MCEIEGYQSQVAAYRNVIDDKGAQTIELKRENEALKAQLGQTSKGMPWDIGAFFYKGGQRASCNHNIEELGSAYESRIEKQIDEIEKLKQLLKEKEAQLQRQKMKFSRQLEDLRHKEAVTSPKTTDLEIKGKWTQLAFLIRQLVESHLDVAFDQTTVREVPVIPTFPAALQYQLQSSRLRPLILEAGVWHHLYFHIFRPHASHWGGPVGETFASAFQKISGIIKDTDSSKSQKSAMEEFHDWRTRSVGFAKLTTDAGFNLQAAANRFCETMVWPITGQSQAAGDDVTEIISLAAELDLILRSSKADFTVFITNLNLAGKPPNFWFPYDLNIMGFTHRLRPPHDIYEVDSAVIVDVAVTPGILKRGTADGKKYDNVMVLVKLEALCSEQTAYDGLKVPDQLTPQRQKSDRKKHNIKKEEIEDWRNEDVDLVAFPPRWK
ncbi:hypothetical protein QBC41DRAFT_216785 [Cercophora samala]|uniref:Uncharacterized protein n=1 Tax=Cercophora samala TaxID=330535 RepID=A0AA39ZKI7_9PEZI|nr:hypothetical protein QBC41DRAFT_216785 [Cercophora samala]